jgi:hypothetical protein
MSCIFLATPHLLLTLGSQLQEKEVSTCLSVSDDSLIMELVLRVVFIILVSFLFPQSQKTSQLCFVNTGITDPLIAESLG